MSEFNWTERNEVMSRRLQQREVWLNETSHGLAIKHKISDAGAQRKLLAALKSAKDFTVSAAILEPDGWKIPRDLTSWEDARAKLTAFARDLMSVSRALDEILKDDVMFTALNRAANSLPFQELPQLVRAITQLSQVAVEAAATEGKRGNRPLPAWKLEATNFCREFWLKNMNEQPKRYFNAAKKPSRGERSNRTTEPANAFSRWFCDVMREVDGLTPSECDTLLRQQ
jgi:hypothetical protein